MISLPVQNKKPRLGTWLVGIIGTLVIGALTATPVFATYSKTTYGGPAVYQPGQQATIQIKIPPLSSSAVTPVEAVFVVDLSGSISGQVDQFKSNLTTFANNLSGSYGRIKVGIVTFGNDPTKNDDDPQIKIPEPLTLISGATDVTNLKNAVNSIQARDDGLGFSDIEKGLETGNGLFSSATTGKYLALLTDGFDNMPAYGSQFAGGGGNFNGVCLLNGSGNPAFTPKYTQLTLADANNGTNVPVGTEYGRYDINMDPVIWPCTPYLDNFYGGNVISGTQLLKDMDSRYPNTIYSLDLNDPIKAATPSYIQVHDIVNTDIFPNQSPNPTLTNGVFYNCDTNNALASSGFYPHNRRFNAQVTYSFNVSNYCLRFTSTLQDGLAAGTYPLDNPNVTTPDPSQPYENGTAGVYNVVQYYNYFGNLMYQDYVAAGSITIGGPNLVIQNPNGFQLTDANGNAKTTFAKGEQIYVKYTPGNSGSTNSTSGAISQFYENQPNTVGVNTGSDIPGGFSLAHGVFTAGNYYSYCSFPNNVPAGCYAGYFRNSANATVNSWSMSLAGQYTARVYVNYNQAVSETSYSDNQATVSYTVGTPPPAPINPTYSNVTCSSAHLSWTGASGATSYKVTYSPNDGSPSSGATATGTSMDLASLSGNTSYTFSVQSFTDNLGGGTAGPISFKTKPCDPTPQTPQNNSCKSETLSWTAPAADHFNLTVSIKGGATIINNQNIGFRSSYQVTGLQGSTTYIWSIQAVGSPPDNLTSATVSGSQFQTPVCKDFAVSVGPNPLYLTPGGGSGIETITYLSPYPTGWTTSDSINAAIYAFVTGSNNCSSYTAGVSTPNNTPPGSSRLTADFGSGAASVTTYAPTSQATVTLTAARGATQGTYTICLGEWSTSAPDDVFMQAVTIKTQIVPWIQIFGSPSTASFTGDVHSNAAISNIVPPSGSYFFKDGVAGVVSATGSISLSSSQLANTTPSYDWLIPNYVSTGQGGTVETSDFSDLLTNLPVAPSSGQPNNTTITANCATNKQGAFSSTGNFTISSAINFSPAAGCEGDSQIYFIDGNLTVNANVVDSTNGGTLTFIVHGNITLSPTVTELDGVYLFQGHFDDGAGGNQLLVKGSLIGLATSQPNSGTGSFTTGTISGLERDLGSSNTTTPAEEIYYQPKYVYQVRSYLGGSTFTWTE